MLKIRLSRHGRTHRPFFRVVLTEHTKPSQSGYQKVLWWYDPLNHKHEIDIEEIRKYTANGAQLSERVAKIAYKESKDEFFKKFYTEKDIKRAKKNEDKKK